MERVGDSPLSSPLPGQPQGTDEPAELGKATPRDVGGGLGPLMLWSGGPGNYGAYWVSGRRRFGPRALDLDRSPPPALGLLNEPDPLAEVRRHAAALTSKVEALVDLPTDDDDGESVSEQPLYADVSLGFADFDLSWMDRHRSSSDASGSSTKIDTPPMKRQATATD